MGVLTKRVLGNVSGKVGDLQFRQRGDLNYIALNPQSFIPGTDEASVARRDKFALAVKFGSAVNSIDLVRAAWKPVTPANVSPYNLMVQRNYPYIADGIIGDRAMIMPDLGFAASATTLGLTEAGLAAVFEALGASTEIDDTVERDIFLAAVVYLSNPVVETDKPCEFLSLLSASQITDLVNPLSFDIPLDSIEVQMFNAYQDVDVFAALLTTDANGTPVHFSTTLAG